MDLSIARWIRGLQNPTNEEETNENENEVIKNIYMLHLLHFFLYSM